MMIKVYLSRGWKIIEVGSIDEVQAIASKYQRWEYVR